MNEFIFVSDFDGTLTEKDFYQIIIDKYSGNWGRELYTKWQNLEIKDIDFLGKIFESIKRNEEEIFQDILSIKLDSNVKNFIEKIQKSGGEFLVLSAGTSYYIDKLFEYHGIKDITIISNKGIYKDNGIKLMPDPNSPHYSERYGVDKSLVVRDLKSKYKKLYYAGDSQPDLEAALLADITFAKGRLINLIKETKHSSVPFESFGEIEKYLIEKGVIK